MFGFLNRPLIKMLSERWASLPADKRREKLGSFEGQSSAVINLLLFIVKLIAGLYSGSLALITDAFHSVSDCLTSIVVIVGFRFAHKEADEEHPFGHGRAEHISTLIIAILLMITGVELGRMSFDRLLDPQPFTAGTWLLIGVAMTILVKEGMADLSMRLGRKIESDALIADAWHHRVDALSSMLVLVALAGQGFGWFWLDGLVGLGVAGLVGYSGFEIARDTIDRLMGRAPDPELLAKMQQQVLGTKGVEGLHEVIVHDYGLRRHVSLHIEVCQNQPLLKAHDIAEDVEHLLEENFQAHAAVHIDPVDLANPARQIMLQKIDELISPLQIIQSFDLRIREQQNGTELHFGLVWAPGTQKELMDKESGTVEAALIKQFPELIAIRIGKRHSFHT